MAKVTIRDVAEAAGVGIGTVSRVLNNNANVSDKTRENVTAIIEKLGFVPNAAARQLPRKTPYQPIGVITRTFFEHYSFAERLRGVQEALKPHTNKFDLTLHNMHNIENYDERLLSIIENSMVAGLLIIDFHLTQEQKEALNQLGIPYVGLNHIRDAEDWLCVGTDNIQGGYLATNYLIELGHRDIAYMGTDLIEEDGFITSKERYTGYLQALHDANIAPNDNYFRVGALGYEAAVAMAHSLLELSKPPTAIFAMSDAQALACIAAARERNLSVPDDLSIIGYDDLQMSEYIGLTTIRQHLEQIGYIAMAHLLQMIRHDLSVQIPPLPDLEIIARNTTRHL